MNGRNQISSRQFFIFVFLITIGDAILVLPSSMSVAAKQNAWIPAVVGTGMGLLLVWLYVSINKLSNKKTLFEINEEMLGKPIGWTISLLLTATTLLFSAELIFYIGNFILVQFMPDAPILWINLLFSSIIVMGTRLGLQTILRTAEVLFPWLVFFLIILILFTAPNVKIDRLLPLFDVSLPSIIIAAYAYTSYAFIPFIFMLVIISSKVIRPADAYRGLFLGSALGGLVFIIIIVLSVGVMGAQMTAIETFPSYELAKSILIGGFLQRIEATMAVIWFITTYLEITFYMLCTLEGLRYLFKLKQPQSLSLPLGWIIVVLSTIVYPSVAYMQEWDTRTWSAYALVLGILYPLLLLIIGTIRKRMNLRNSTGRSKL